MDTRIKTITGKGTYVLHLALKSDIQIKVGRLGINPFDAGHYAYVGRAFGPGGLTARLKHHLRYNGAPHWHLDYLRVHGRVREIWYARTTPATEHLWAQALMQIQGVRIPLRGFGSSDCRCLSHLLQFDRPPCKSTFRRRLLPLVAGKTPPIHCVQVASPADGSAQEVQSA